VWGLLVLGCWGCGSSAEDPPALAAPPVAEEGDWSIGSTTLRYRTIGTGQPVVLLHGGPGGNFLGFGPLEELADSYQLIMYDQRGSGESARLPLSATNQDATLMSVARHVEDLEEIRVLLGLESLVLLGHSWGATLAAFYANAHPDRVAKLVLYDGGPEWQELSEQGQAEQESRLDTEELAALEAAYSEMQANVAVWSQEQLDAWMVEVVAMLAPTLVCDPGGESAEIPGRGGFWANVLTGRYIDAFDANAFSSTLSAVEAPTLVTYGRCEPTPMVRQTFLRDALPNATMVVFEQSGHQALTEEHDLFIRTIRAFLADEALPLPSYTGD
jgi:proline iminopeptidase